MSWLLVALSILSNATASALVKSTSLSIAGKSRLTALTTRGSSLRSCVYGFAFLTYAAAVERMPLNVAHPTITSGALIMVGLASAFIFHERFRSRKYHGVFIVARGHYRARLDPVVMQRTDQTRQVPAYRIDRWIGRSGAYCVVIPVINEADRIGRLLGRMSALELAKQADLIVVDGGSTDGSLSEERLEAAGVAGLIVKTGPGRLSAQLRCVYDFALIQGYEGIVTIDGNDKDDPQAVPAFINALKDGHDFVQASRFIAGGIEENTPWKRRLAIRLIHAPLLRLASGFPWTDTTQGFRAYSRRLLEDPRHEPVSGCLHLIRAAGLHELSRTAAWLSVYRAAHRPSLSEGRGDPTKISSFRGELGY